MRIFSRSLPIVLLLAVSAVASAQTIPFSVAGRGGGEGFSVIGDDSAFTVSGLSFPVGFYRGEDGNAISQTFDGVQGTFKGTFSFVNRWTGAKLATTFGDVSNGAKSVGTYMAIPVSEELVRILFIAEFNPIVGESTKQFANVSGGSLTMYALTDPIPPTFVGGRSVPFEFNWVGFGSLTFGDVDDDD